MIHIKNIFKQFGNQIVLGGVNTQISQGEVVAIVGSSGSGKSTLLRCINHLETPCSGEISFSKTPIRIGMVFQNFNLFPNLSVINNLTYAPIHVLKMTPAAAIEKAQKLLANIGLEHKMDAQPRTLSGGEKQRVAIVRTLMMNPDVILFDEPTSALDPTRVQEVLQMMRTLANSGMTLVMVTHEMDFVREVADRVIHLSQGKIVQDCTTEHYFSNTSRAKTSSSPTLKAVLDHRSLTATPLLAAGS